jgi:hypothetical protein
MAEQRVDRRVTEDQRRVVDSYINQELDTDTKDIEYLRQGFEQAIAYGKLSANRGDF